MFQVKRSGKNSRPDSISECSIGPQAVSRIEPLTVPTAKRPEVPYDFSAKFYKFPCYLRRSAIRALERIHEDITNLRDDWQWNLAHELCRAYDTLCIEDLQLTGMSRLWGRKMADLAFGSFVQKLENTAAKYDCEVREVDRFYPSSRTCSVCQYVNEHLSLRDRSWTCPECGAVLDRDMNAAKNILRQGIASSGSPRKTKVTLRKGR